MATKRKRGTGSWEFIVRRKGLLPKPISLTFNDEAEGDAYIAHLEKLLDQGIVPAEFKEKAKPVTTLSMAIAEYLDAVHVTVEDVCILNGLHKSLKDMELPKIKYGWAEEWVKELRATNLAPSTIRKKVGRWRAVWIGCYAVRTRCWPAIRFGCCLSDTPPCV